MVHKPKHKVHSFRGLLSSGIQDEINLERQNVNMAYRMTKFSLLPSSPDLNTETTIKVYREQQSSIVATIDLGDPDLIAAGIFTQKDDSSNAVELYVVVDTMLFSRNIWVSQLGTSYTAAINYYIEIEEVPVTASTLMQLKLQVARKLNLKQEPIPT